MRLSYNERMGAQSHAGTRGGQVAELRETGVLRCWVLCLFQSVLLPLDAQQSTYNTGVVDGTYVLWKP